MLEEILKKESLGEEDMAIISANLRDVPEADLIRLGFKEAPAEKPKAVKKPAAKKK